MEIFDRQARDDVPDNMAYMSGLMFGQLGDTQGVVLAERTTKLAFSAQEHRKSSIGVQSPRFGWTAFAIRFQPFTSFGHAATYDA
jgi:hypothetical protein